MKKTLSAEEYMKYTKNTVVQLELYFINFEKTILLLTHTHTQKLTQKAKSLINYLVVKYFFIYHH